MIPKLNTLTIQMRVKVGFPCISAGQESACKAGDLGSTLGWEDPLEKGKATHSSILSWRIPWTIQSMESQSVQIGRAHV